LVTSSPAISSADATSFARPHSSSCSRTAARARLHRGPARPRTVEPGDARLAVGQILQTDAARLDPTLPIQDYGIDSLMAVETRTTLRQRLDVEIPPMELLQSGITLTDLSRFVLLRLSARTTDTAGG
jgi:acyl carrier protein